MNLQVLGSQMALSCEEHLNILGSSIEDWGELGRCHLCNLTCDDSQILGWEVFGLKVGKVDREVEKRNVAIVRLSDRREGVNIVPLQWR